MKISTEQLDKVAAVEGLLTPPENVVDTAVIKLMDADLIKAVTAEVNALPDRDEVVAGLKAKVESGEYKASADEIVDTMLRRAKADRIS